MTRWLWHLRKTVGRLWFRSSVFGVVAIITALLAYYFKDTIPEDVSQKIGADAVDSLLNIIASTMLAVTTFSLSTMVAAYAAATTNVTPRSTQLLLQDKTSQTALSTFIGAFIFSLVGIIALKIGIYGSSGRLILFVVTIIVIAFIIVTLIRWIEYLSTLGRVSETIKRVEQATKSATMERIKHPYLGGVCCTMTEAEIRVAAKPVSVSSIGYVQLVDMAALSDIAEEAKGEIYVLAIPGAFNTPDRPVAYAKGIDLEKFQGRIERAFVIAEGRSFEQDPRFGLIVLSEIASRALSPAVNDPGTAIEVIGAAVRILSLWHTEKKDERPEVKYPRIFVPPMRYQDLFEDAFVPIGRDGAGVREVVIRLQKSLLALSLMGTDEFSRAAHGVSLDGLARAKNALTVGDDYQIVADIGQAIRKR